MLSQKKLGKSDSIEKENTAEGEDGKPRKKKHHKDKDKCEICIERR